MSESRKRERASNTARRSSAQASALQRAMTTARLRSARPSQRFAAQRVHASDAPFTYDVRIDEADARKARGHVLHHTPSAHRGQPRRFVGVGGTIVLHAPCARGYE